MAAYLHLVERRGGTASEIARAVGTPRGRVYDTLRALIAHGLAEERLGRPKRYEAVSPTEVVALARQRLQAAMRSLERAAALLPQEAPSLPLPYVTASDLALVSGRRSLLAEFSRVLLREQEFAIVWAPPAFHRQLAQNRKLAACLRDALDRGVRVDHVVHGRAPDVRPAVDAVRSVFPRASVHERIVPPTPLAGVVTATTTLLIWLQPPGFDKMRGDDQCVRVRSAEVAKAVARWARPTISDTPAPFSLQDAQGVAQRFLGALSEARKQVRGMGPPGWTQFLQEGGVALQDAFEDARARGVALRGLTCDDLGERALMETFGRAWDIRRHPDVASWAVLIDDEHLFEAFARRPESGPQQLQHSTDPQRVRQMAAVFERLWRAGTPLSAASPVHFPRAGRTPTDRSA